jgi:hypothetical protein
MCASLLPSSLPSPQKHAWQRIQKARACRRLIEQERPSQEPMNAASPKLEQTGTYSESQECDGLPHQDALATPSFHHGGASAVAAAAAIVQQLRDLSGIRAGLAASRSNPKATFKQPSGPLGSAAGRAADQRSSPKLTLKQRSGPSRRALSGRASPKPTLKQRSGPSGRAVGSDAAQPPRATAHPMACASRGRACGRVSVAEAMENELVRDFLGLEHWDSS